MICWHIAVNEVCVHNVKDSITYHCYKNMIDYTDIDVLSTGL